MVHYQVLVVGAGPTGLSLAALLARQGVSAGVVEAAAGTSDHPQAHVINRRTDEIFRNIGIAGDVHAQVDHAALGGVWFIQSIAGATLAWFDTRTALTPDELRSQAQLSAATGTSCPQDLIEPLLLGCARTHGADVHFDSRLTAIDVGAAGVVATVESAAGNRQLHADWVVGCDGAGSTTRRLSGIEMVGPEPFAHVVGIYFHADLAAHNGGRRGILYFTIDTQYPVTLICMGHNRWVAHVMYDGASDIATQFTPEHCRTIVNTIAGAQIDADIRSVKPWAMTAQVAASYRNGRVLLAGDAAHRFPPTGGFGLNTGVQDAHNLAWKLAAVIRGVAGEALIDTYESERRPVAQANTEFSVRNAMGMASAMGPGALMQAQRVDSGEITLEQLGAELQALLDREAAHFGAPGRELGYAYTDGALVPDGSAAPVVSDADLEYVPNARPGARAPHLPVTHRGQQVGIHDLFGEHFTLLTDAADSSAVNAWRAACSAAVLDVRCVAVGESEGEGEYVIADVDAFRQAYGLSAGGAVLVRPDGHVGWRTPGPVDAPAATLQAVLLEICQAVKPHAHLD